MPQQPNGYDCGIYVMMAAEAIYKHGQNLQGTQVPTSVCPVQRALVHELSLLGTIKCL